MSYKSDIRLFNMKPTNQLVTAWNEGLTLVGKKLDYTRLRESLYSRINWLHYISPFLLILDRQQTAADGHSKDREQVKALGQFQ